MTSWRVSKRRHRLSCVCQSHVQCWFSHGNWTTAYYRTKQLSRVNSPVLHQYFRRVACISVHFLTVPCAAVMPTFTWCQKEGYELHKRRRGLLEEATLQALAICLSFLLSARRQVTTVTRTMIYSLSPLDVLNHLVSWIRLGRQPCVFFLGASSNRLFGIQYQHCNTDFWHWKDFLSFPVHEQGLMAENEGKKMNAVWKGPVTALKSRMSLSYMHMPAWEVFFTFQVQAVLGGKRETLQHFSKMWMN